MPKRKRKNLDVAVAGTKGDAVMIMSEKDWRVLFAAAVEHDDSIYVTTHDPRGLLDDEAA